MNKRNSLFLMANLGSEFSKIFSHLDERNSNFFIYAMKKARSIIKELKSLPETKNNQEIDILESIIDDIDKNSRKYDVSKSQMNSYFYPFATRMMQI